MKAISVRAPWWWFILHAGKDIENRGLRFQRGMRGRVLLHASKYWNLDEVAEDAQDALLMRDRMNPKPNGTAGITYREMRDVGGCLVGSIEIVDEVTSSDSPWFVGELGLVLRNPVAFATPIPFRGMLGFFDVPDSITNGIPELSLRGK